ncbi:TonB-dependent receptor plug domain-containing protein [Phenylobacterium immobile]|uniref:TonB-dependent receptor plug domain-containing protein n=1 Tax=Phenylobacterium immobile TaxID=21 RepID=UPI000A57E3FF|nr:TonB-dependent receptor [Phenylobacterium immobile]
MRSQLIICLLASAAAGPVFAQTPVSELVVTRLPTTPDLVTGARVIDRAEIEARRTSFAADLLSTVPGVGFTRNGGFGGVTALKIRGATADKTLVLIDGVPAGDAADPNGSFDASSLQLADLERIEILSGPQSSLWGSEAIGGVISFTTRELAGLRAEVEGGSMETVRGFLGAGVASEAYALNATLAGFRTDGVSKAALGAEKDGFKTYTASLGGRAQLGGLRLDGRVRRAESDIDIDGYAPPAYLLGDLDDRNKSRTWSGFVRATAQALGFEHQLSASLYDIKRDNISGFASSYAADRQVYRYTAALGRTLVVGAERTDTNADLDGRPSQDLSNTAAFAVARVSPLERLTITASARIDDPDQFRSKATGRIAAALDLGAGFTLTGSAGTGFKTPTISQYVCDFCFAPTVALRPEFARGYDLRLGWTSEDGRHSAAVTGYRLRVKDQIVYAGVGRYENVSRTRGEGLEAEALLGLTAALRLKLAYARTEAEDGSTGITLLRTPKTSGAAALLWVQDRWSGSLTARGESRQIDTDLDGFSRVVRKGFVVADVAGAYRVTEGVELTGRVENLGDRRYQETFGYGETGRAVYVGVRLRR